jgi:glutathione synthase/RimK-type ligase-like ATP-grasp enzyme
MAPKRKILFLLREYLSDKMYLRVRYAVVFKKWLHLKHPRTFNEKINWLKLYYKNVELSKFADKYEVRDYVQKQVGASYLNTLHGVYNNVEDINWDGLPQKFVLKATHGSGWVIICNDKNHFNFEKSKKEMQKWMNQNYYDLWGEGVYKHLQARIICEKYLEGNPETGLVDYKFYCFNGQPRFLHVDVNRFNDKHYINFYDLEWNKLPLRKGLPNSPQVNRKPDKFDEMITVAKRLSQNLPFVRIDLYEEQQQVFFGEMTFYPQNGLSSFYPTRYEREFGDLINLNNIKKPKKKFFNISSWLFIHRLRQRLSKFYWFEKLIVKYKLKKGDFQDDDFINYMNSADKVLLSTSETGKLPKVGLVKDIDNYGSYVQKRSHWPKYERFLINNEIPYSFFDFQASDWIEKAKKFDLIIFRPDNSPSAIHEAKTKISFIERYLNKMCFPGSHEIWAYEDKVRANYLYKYFDIPHINTFISNNKNESLAYADTCRFPLVSKISCGSVSRGVQLIDTKKKAKKMIKKIFSQGIQTYWPEQRQKNYVYFQEFIPDAYFDLRIIIVNHSITGYYRLTPDHDFRASGSGIWQLHVTELPKEAMDLAVKLKEALNMTVVAVDLIKPKGSDQYFVIESSVFFDVDFPSELYINNIAGYYQWKRKGTAVTYKFKPGKFWVQELIAHELIRKYQNQIEAK